MYFPPRRSSDLAWLLTSIDKIRVGHCAGQWPRKGGNSGVAVPASPQNKCRALNNPGSNAQSLARRSPVLATTGQRAAAFIHQHPRCQFLPTPPHGYGIARRRGGRQAWPPPSSQRYRHRQSQYSSKVASSVQARVLPTLIFHQHTAGRLIGVEPVGGVARLQRVNEGVHSAVTRKAGDRKSVV